MDSAVPGEGVLPSAAIVVDRVSHTVFRTLLVANTPSLSRQGGGIVDYRKAVRNNGQAHGSDICCVDVGIGPSASATMIWMMMMHDDDDDWR